MVDFWLGANPMILVITKVDLLAKGTDFNCIGDWVVEATVKKKLNVMSVHLTSSKSLVGVAGVALEIQKKKKGRDVDVMVSFLVGILEVYLVLRLRKCWEISFYECFTDTVTPELMAEKDPVAASAQKYKPIQSAVPGTSLGPIQINAFLGGGVCQGICILPMAFQNLVE
ncbi:hypothetical protein ABKV19_024416 [Rosa sericea]